MGRRTGATALEDATADAKRAEAVFLKLDKANVEYSMAQDERAITACRRQLVALGLFKEKPLKKKQGNAGAEEVCEQPGETVESETVQARNKKLEIYREMPLIKASPYADKMGTEVHRNFHTWYKVPPSFFVAALGTAEPISMHEALLKAAYCGKNQKVPPQDVLHQLYEHMTDMDLSQTVGDERTLLEICAKTINSNEANNRRLQNFTLPAQWDGKDAVWKNRLDDQGTLWVRPFMEPWLPVPHEKLGGVEPADWQSFTLNWSKLRCKMVPPDGGRAGPIECNTLYESLKMFYSTQPLSSIQPSVVTPGVVIEELSLEKR